GDAPPGCRGRRVDRGLCAADRGRLGDALPLRLVAVPRNSARQRLETARCAGTLSRALLAVPERADRSGTLCPALKRSKGANELVGERRDGSQEAIGLDAAEEQREEHERADDTGDGSPLDAPSLGRGA